MKLNGFFRSSLLGVQGDYTPGLGSSPLHLASGLTQKRFAMARALLPLVALAFLTIFPLAASGHSAAVILPFTMTFTGPEEVVIPSGQYGVSQITDGPISFRRTEFAPRRSSPLGRLRGSWCAAA